jgi:CheY-like chemotaxis protein
MLVDHRPGLVALDLCLPGMSGAQMLDTMRRTPGLLTMPVIISTPTPERAPRGVAILPKPIDVDAFCDCVRRSCCGVDAKPA